MATVTATVTPVEEISKSEKEAETSSQEPLASVQTLLQVAATAARRHIRRLKSAHIPESFKQQWHKITSWLWYWIEELFEEFQPWLKWVIFDAALTLVVGWVVQRITALRPFFEAVGWA